MKNDPSLPRHTKVFVYSLAIKELMHQLCNLLLHLLIQNNIIPTRILHLLIQHFTPDPIPVVHINPLIPQRRRDLPFPNRLDQFIRLPISRHYRLPFRWFFEYVLHGIPADTHDIDDEVLVAPFVEIFRECAGFGERGWLEEIARAEDGFVDYVEGRGCVAGEGEGEEID